MREKLLGKSNRAEEKHVELEPPVSQRQCLDWPGPLCTRIVTIAWSLPPAAILALTISTAAAI